MDVLELRKELTGIKKEKQSFLDDTYLWVEIARNSIQEMPEDKIKFEVPNTKGNKKKIQRTDKKNMILRMTTKDIYYSGYIMLISSIEDYLNKIMKLLLLYDNNRIKVTIPNASMQTSIDIIDFINASKDEMINDIVEQRVNNLFYASPQKQLEYMDKALGINISQEDWYIWVEYKARRDVIVHNSGIVNDVYCSKVNGYGRYAKHDTVTFNETEFANVISTLKRIVESIDSLIRKEYHIPNEKEVKEYISEDLYQQFVKINDELAKI